jgi:formylglycine-generating enzyme required for sulfatase activity
VLDLGAGVKLGLAPIPVGEFTMGSPDGEKSRERNEGPAHAVRIAKPFLMGVCEVTQEQYQAVMGHNPSHFRTPKYPVEGVSWTEAQEFCRKLSQKTGEAVRLPTEAEWEYACRAGSVTPFHFGGTISTVQADYDGSGIYGDGRKGEWRRKTVPVGSFAANAFGLYDMHGNVWEWCGSAYKEYPYRADDGRENPAVTADRVTRGGGWAEDPRHCRSARRGREPQTRRSNGIGFRVVVDPK